ncbi:hypothetical protein [Methylococcus mesophilus]|uniref:hypothetical protein n=1 Tax=Methylococcus mesophilus TaxID=2993564 RepID=UPI00224AF4D7|nr:hypothetical protein [Methylococcus mesophilus]UZR28921.1 hypothetical protein OOT43_19775 [Methylococcus mesophilus]
MLVGALAVFTLVALMGLAMICDVWAGRPVEPAYPILHGVASLVGSALVIVAALEGDTRLYLNIGMAVVIIGLGLLMGLTAKKGKRVPRAILVAHVGLAVTCYLALGFFAFNPSATLI